MSHCVWKPILNNWLLLQCKILGKQMLRQITIWCIIIFSCNSIFNQNVSVYYPLCLCYPHAQCLLCIKDGPATIECPNKDNFCCQFENTLQRSSIYWVFNIRFRSSCEGTVLSLPGILKVCFLGWLFLAPKHFILKERLLYVIDPENLVC